VGARLRGLSAEERVARFLGQGAARTRKWRAKQQRDVTGGDVTTNGAVTSPPDRV